MDNVQLDAYLFFQGNCRQAMEFYQKVFGGKLELQTFDQIPDEAKMPGMQGKIMHANLKGGEINLMASDSTRLEPFGASNISLSLSGNDFEKLSKLFNQLSEKGTVTQKLEKMFWGDTFGAVTDQFGIDWMVNIGDKNE